MFDQIIPKWIKMYVTPEGKVPFQEWLESLKDTQVRSHIKIRLDRLRLGNFGDVKSIQNGLMELRIHRGSGFRVYFGILNNQLVLLLCGGDKSSQKKDIQKALKYWSDYRGLNA